MTLQSSTDVLICGAGAAGLTLAIELARRGVAFRLIDRNHGPFAGSRGKGIQPRTQEIFEDLGILDRLVATGGLYPPPRKYRADGTWTDLPFDGQFESTPAEPYRLPLLVPQFLTEGVMRDRLAELGGEVAFGVALVDFGQDEQGVWARLSTPGGEEVARARYLIGADGGRSLVRRSLDIAFPGKTLGMRAVVADVTLAGLAPDAWHQFGEGGMDAFVSLCPLRGTDLFQLQAPVPQEGEPDLSAAGLTRLVAERTDRDDIVVESVSWASAYDMNARLADRYRIERVLLVGDAAHIHPPTGGQGLNTSVQDAYNLGWKLAAVLDGAPEALLDTYEEERRPIAADVLGLSTRLLDQAKRGDMRRGREVDQLGIGYAGSTLAPENPQRNGRLRAGDRAPDAPIRGAAGQPTRLFELFKGPHWTLLCSATTGETVASRAGLRSYCFGPRGGFIDDEHHFGDAYALADGERVLVRPDGYIGAILPPGGTGPVDEYLLRVGVCR